jgi:hypothetical protein
MCQSPRGSVDTVTRYGISIPSRGYEWLRNAFRESVCIRRDPIKYVRTIVKLIVLASVHKGHVEVNVMR